MNASNAEIRAEVLSKLRSVEKVVLDLEVKISELTDELATEVHRLEVIGEYFRLEYGNIPNSIAVPTGNGSLFTIPKRFENLTIRESCRQVLKGKGNMHVGDIIAAMQDGGLPTVVNSVTSVLIRSDEFGKTEGKPNTFYLIEDDSS